MASLILIERNRHLTRALRKRLDTHEVLRIYHMPRYGPGITPMLLDRGGFVKETARASIPIFYHPIPAQSHLQVVMNRNVRMWLRPHHVHQRVISEVNRNASLRGVGAKMKHAVWRRPKNSS